MIDTDKYEGHTPAPWTLSEEYAYELFIYAGDVRLAKMDGNAPLHTNEHGNPEDVNAQLMADAPLLLEEVWRLREHQRYLRGLLDHYKGELTNEHAEVKRLRHELDIKEEALAKSQSSYKELRKQLKAAIE